MRTLNYLVSNTRSRTWQRIEPRSKLGPLRSKFQGRPTPDPNLPGVIAVDEAPGEKGSDHEQEESGMSG